MRTNLRTFHKLVASLLLIVALLGSGLNLMVAQAATLTSTTCTGTGTVTCNLWTQSATIALPGTASVKIWGYTDSSTGVLTAPGGPTLIVNQGDVVTVILHNSLPEASSLLFQGQAMIPDTVGVTTGNSKSYTFTATNAGTYLYEAGLVPNAQHQVAMGLYGALIVRPATANQAYVNLTTAYNDEALVLLSELDTTLNNSANPAAFDMRNYHPRYWLINGKVFPNTDTINTTPGNKLLLRYVNAGLQIHSMSLLGLNQTVIATDGSPLANAFTYVADSIAPGQTLDAITTIPAATTNGSRFALYEASLLQHNNNGAGFGGMLTFIQAGTGSIIIGPDTTGPATSAVSLTPNPSNGSANVAISASISDVASGNSNVTAAEYFIDASGANGAGTAMAGTFGSPTASVNATLTVAQLALLTGVNHTLYVHGVDSLGNWGPFNIATLVLDKTGPTASALSLSPNVTNGTVNVAITATGNDSASGNSNVTAAEYFLDPVGTPANGSGIAMSVNVAAPIAGLSASISAATVNALSSGSHTVAARSKDALGNWGALVNTTLTVDKAGPATSTVSAAPNPNNGSTPLNTSTPVVRVSASFLDAQTNISAAEGFIDTVGANGTGFAFVANDGAFNSLGESGYGDIPIAVIGTLTQGNHTIYVHGKDAAGNWGSTSTTVLVIDKVGPTTSALTLTPAATNTNAVAISASASDVATGNSNISAGEFFIDAVGANGGGTALSVSAAAPTASLSGSIPTATLNGLTAGNHTVYVHAKDAAGNWGATVSATLLIDRTPPTFSGITLTPNSIPAGTASVNLTVNGASDGAGGSGVAGGEYWFGTTNITAGTGTAFSGLTASINTSALAAGITTVRVRIRDVAGNWSTGTNGVRTATLTVTAPIPDVIFTDGFESPTTLPGNWTSASTTTTTRLNNTTTAALVGLRGLQAQGNNTNYVQYNFGTVANPVTATFDARFYFNPNNNASTGQDIFRASTGTSNASFNSPLFSVRYRRNGTQPQVQIQVGATANAAWVNITNNASNYIEVVWQSGTTLQLYVNGTLSQTLTAGAGSVSAFRLGSVTSGTSATLEYFDAISAKRSVSPLVGP